MRLAFRCSYVVFVLTQRCARRSRTERENASKRSRALAIFGSMARSKTRCHSYNAFSVPTNGIGPHPYSWRRSEILTGFALIGTTFAASVRPTGFVLIRVLAFRLI